MLGQKVTEKSWHLSPVREAVMELGPQGQRLFPSVNTTLSGSSQLSIGTVLMPPGGISRAHVHNRYELVVVVVEGLAATLLGPDLEPAVQGPGDFLLIPAGVPHVAVNLRADHRVLAIETRADPDFNNDVELLPELDAKAAEMATLVRAKHGDQFTGEVFTDLL